MLGTRGRRGVRGAGLDRAGNEVWRDRARRGETGRPCRIDEPGVVAETTANSVSAGCGGRDRMARSLRRSSTRGAAGGSGSEPGANARLARKEPATRSARRSGRLAHAETAGDTGSSEHATHARIGASLRGWAGHPCHSAPCSSRPEHAVPAEPRQARQRSAGRSPSRPARITRWAGRRVCLSGDSCLLE